MTKTSNPPGIGWTKRRYGFSEIFIWIPRAYLVLLVLIAIFGTSVGGGWNGNIGKPYVSSSSSHWLGTDALGRDEFARLAYGARISLGIGLSSLAICVIIGVGLGLAAAFGGKWVRGIIMRFTDVMFSFPDVLLAILLAGILMAHSSSDTGLLGQLMDSGILPVVVAISVTSWPSYCRLTYTQSLAIKELDFVEASRAMGAKRSYLAFRHVLPQIAPMIVAVGMVDLGGFILAESAFSFLGIGIMPPVPSWGSMINTARDAMSSYPLWLLWPCLFLSVTIIALNFVGDDIRNRLDKRSSQK